MKKALITGITGQDGAYLTEFLLGKGYEVHGIKRRSSLFNTDRIDHLYEGPHKENARLKLHFGDLSDSMNLTRLIQEIQPDEIYNLGAMSHVRVSFDTPEYVANVDGLGTLRLLEAVRILGLANKTKIYQAGTSELYGMAQEIPQNESTPFYPRSPYAVAKVYAHWITVNYREAYQMFACNGILFNHESPLRGETFVTRKITRALSRMALGLDDCLYLGNLEAKRDWGHAKDFVRGMWLMLQQEQPDDYVLATGNTYSIREFIEKAFDFFEVKLEYFGNGPDEYAIIKSHNSQYKFKTGQVVLKIDPKYYRPTEVAILQGDATKARTVLGWKPEYDLDDLIKEMLESDLDLFRLEKDLSERGHRVLRKNE